MASLVEARRDGRLGERESASLSRHLGTCKACLALKRDLDEVRDLLRRSAMPPLTALEHQRNRLALLRAAAAPPGQDGRAGPASAPARGGRRRMVSRGVGAAGVVAAAAVALGLALTPRPTVAVAQHLPGIAHPGHAGVSRAYPTDTILHGSADARFEQQVSADGVDRVALREGTLDLAVRKLTPGERFVVATDDAEVEVRGTVFEVEAHAGRIARVQVSEGNVEVRHQGTRSVVSAGGAWHPPEAMAVVAGDPADEQSRESGRGLTLATRAGSSGISAARTSVSSPVPSVTAPVPSITAAGSAPDEGNDASKTFGEAVNLLGRGDYGAARKELDAFRAAHPADPRADLAAFLTIVSFQRAGRRAAAQDAARRYLELYPNGDRRAEVARVLGR